ncbi:MAG: hypothetical protein Unbinned706contig1000_33 [Prokaryotic dsDNA virus sp.]|nr:MAG: hypothetical protein Unbinned706contig1000_33 [Prokaryotic dsDNA virus sp.]|tara:strand:- start:31634 stop:31762 length:129 start_codon:yes stop_codon:yes gene_type:complete
MKRSDDLDERKFERFVTNVCLVILACVFGYAVLTNVFPWLVG